MTTQPDKEELPPPSFEILIAQIGTPALVQLGQIPNPVTGKTEVSLPRARFTIDLLRIFADRTKGNLTSDEDRALRGFLGQLQTRYAELL
jgi:hypothetical protein